MPTSKDVRLLVAAIGALSLTACGAQLRADFRPSPGAPAAASAVASAEKVRIHYGLVDGFALRDNELVVESGFDHRVLGFIEVVYDHGMCDSSRANKATVEGLLRRAAFERGADAVVLAVNRLKDKGSARDVCSILGRPYGVGWAVVLGGGGKR